MNAPHPAEHDPLADFDFFLPPERIAQQPARPRDSARLLEVNPNGFRDWCVRDLPKLLRPGDVMVVNDTRVIPAQLWGRRGQARIGITLDRPLPDGSWHVLVRNARRIRAGDVIEFLHVEGLLGFVVRRDPDGTAVLRFNREGEEFSAALAQAGALALPPYIKRPQGPLPEDAEDYQTIFARYAGAVAAPTAGLHFTPALLAAIAARGVQRVAVTLHVGAGTFLPLREGDVASKRLHAERGMIDEATAATINAARVAGGRILAIGTTTLRLLETAADENGFVTPFHGETDLFIQPGFRFRVVDLLLTNFHLPRSSLFMLVCAFAGLQRMHQAYSYAINKNYRFYSYGDTSLLYRA